MLASKSSVTTCLYSNKSWCVVGQGMFALQEINQMEHKMCLYLEWQLNVDPSVLVDYHIVVEELLRLDPMYAHPLTLPSLRFGMLTEPVIAAATRSSTPATNWSRLRPSCCVFPCASHPPSKPFGICPLLPLCHWPRRRVPLTALLRNGKGSVVTRATA